MSPSLELAEVVPGSGKPRFALPTLLGDNINLSESSGGMAGSLGLNKRFGEAVQNIVGDDQWLPLKKSVGWARAQNEFDKQVKIAFKGNLDEDFFINFPQADLEDNPDENLISNCWNISGYVASSSRCVNVLVSFMVLTGVVDSS